MKKLFSIYLMFVFIPISLYLHHFHEESFTLVFFSAALAIIPIARLISASTENLSHYTGESIGGLLNATFGNFPEFIIVLMAVKAGLYEMVLASLIGGILANLLLALGVSFLVGGLKYHSQEFNPVSSRVYTSMMVIAVISMVIPGAFSRLSDNGIVRQEHMLNIGIASVLLVTYILYLVFMIRTHRDFFKSEKTENASHQETEKPWSITKAVSLLVVASLLAAWMSEILVGSAEQTGMSLGMSVTFIGVVILAIVGGAAESLSAISMARKNRLDLTLSIALGSCIQIALLIAPLAVLLSYFIGPHPLNLAFGKIELGCIFMSVLMGIILANDGKSNWYKGVQLITIYLLIAILFYFIPG